MKSKFKKMIYLQIFLLVGLLLSFIRTTTPTLVASLSEESPAPMLNALVDHEPIVIEYDENFTDYGFPGTGTPGDPYRIENYNITVSSDYPIMFGGDTSKDFVIQNCFLKTDTNIGIYLGKYYDMADGTVNILNNVIISEGGQGIEMNGGKNSLISGNNITCRYYGILLSGLSDFSTISNNIIYGDEEPGILIENSANMIITKNTCIGNWKGLAFSGVSDSVITHNNLSENECGIGIISSNNLTISNNKIIDQSTRGIEAYTCDNSTFTNNLIQNSFHYAIEFYSGSENNILHHNAFVDNNLGGTSQADDDGTNNIWFDTLALEGNWWSDYMGTGNYSIDGSASSVDSYPLNEVPEIPEFANISLIIVLISSLFAIPVINLVRKK